MLTRVIAQKNSPVHCPVIVKAEVAMNGPYRCRFRLCLDGPFSAATTAGDWSFFRRLSHPPLSTLLWPEKVATGVPLLLL